MNAFVVKYKFVMSHSSLFRHTTQCQAMPEIMMTKADISFQSTAACQIQLLVMVCAVHCLLSKKSYSKVCAFIQGI